MHLKLVAVFDLPLAAQVRAPDALYPLLHVGVHDSPAAVVLQPAGIVAPAMAALKSHVFATQVAGVSVPSLHLVVPETVNLSVHVG